MSKTVSAIYEDGVFKPQEPVSLDESTRVYLIVQPFPKPEEAIQLLNQWMEGDPREQVETWTFLQRVLDEDRPSSRPLFTE